MSGVVLWVVCPKENASSLLSLVAKNGGGQKRSKMCSKLSLSSGVWAYSGTVANPARSSEEKVYEVVLKQAALVREQGRPKDKTLDLNRRIETDGTTNWDLLNEAYDRCGEVCAEYAKTFYLGIFFSHPLNLCLSAFPFNSFSYPVIYYFYNYYMIILIYLLIFFQGLISIIPWSKVVYLYVSLIFSI